MAERRFYDHPPLIEALCQLRFKPGREWDLTVPGLFYGLIKSEFPLRRQQSVFEITLTEEGPREATNRMQFFCSDETALLQVGPNTLIANVLRPYPHWEKFRAMIIDALRHYREAAQPEAVAGIALRYINRLDFHRQDVEIEDYLNFAPSVPKSIPQTWGAWAQSVDVIFPDSVLRLKAGSKTEENLAFVLDLEAFSLAEEFKSDDDVLAWIEETHTRIEEAFEACITNNARNLFKEVRHERTSVG